MIDRKYSCVACDGVCERCGKPTPYNGLVRLVGSAVGLALSAYLVTLIPGCPDLPFWSRVGAIAAIRLLVRR